MLTVLRALPVLLRYIRMSRILGVLMGLRLGGALMWCTTQALVGLVIGVLVSDGLEKNRSKRMEEVISYPSFRPHLLSRKLPCIFHTSSFSLDQPTCQYHCKESSL